MPYPHVIQFETLDHRRRHVVVTGGVPSRATVAPARTRPSLPRVRARLRRTPGALHARSN